MLANAIVRCFIVSVIAASLSISAIAVPYIANAAEQKSEKTYEVAQSIQPLYFRNRENITYLVNGLASSVESIGYGFTNLAKKIPSARLHNYASFVESSTVIPAKILNELKNAYRKNPNVEINLIGISFGANMVTVLAAELKRLNIPVNYLATLEGPVMVPIRSNVRVADNFSCTNLDCFKTSSRLAFNNKATKFQSFKIPTSHIPLANHPQVHERILSQISTLPPRTYRVE